VQDYQDRLNKSCFNQTQQTFPGEDQ